MTTLAEHIIVAVAENRLPMLEKSMYDSWASRIRLFIKGKKHGRMMLDSIDNGSLVYPTVEENGQTRPMKYSKLTDAQHHSDIDFGRKRVSIKLDKQNDPISLEKKIKISPIDYSKLNKIKEDIGKRFVTQKELFAEQVFWLKHSPLSETPVKSILMCRVEALSELHKVNMSQYRFYKNELVLSMSSALINLSSSPQKWTAADRNVEVVPISVLYRRGMAISKNVINNGYEENNCMIKFVIKGVNIRGEILQHDKRFQYIKNIKMEYEKLIVKGFPDKLYYTQKTLKYKRIKVKSLISVQTNGFQRNVLNEKVIINYDGRDSFFGVGNAGCVILNDILVRKSDFHYRGLSQGSLCMIHSRHLRFCFALGEGARQPYVEL
ncbi:hypothetical protein Tco_0842867 [Tanacetum coccineum]|uniref:Retrovirus-related Pol polyprotein from transposon TNT 1-94 n=1 Tax=Tanacetum coccineum TaxID=301880 RepID=A0ABQ5B0G2_9ASTR